MRLFRTYVVEGVNRIAFLRISEESMKLFDENNLTAVITQVSEGIYRAYIPEIDGIYADGPSEEEAEENLMEALKVIKMVSQRDEWKKKRGW
ncbi:MAG: type II toxin-antitoxin system HicB family antitoxin [Saprospiraceae bacterium]|nr:type II toxin-antitoxin system HicB family antitoxin [Saprospiraceae bacterium]